MKILSSITDSQDITDKIYVDNAIATNSPVLSVNGQTGSVNVTAITGNAGTATVLQTARAIGLSGVTATAQSFNGSTDITIPITAVPASGS